MDQPKANNPLEMLQKQKLKAIMLYIISNLKSEKRSVYFIVKTSFLAHQHHMATYSVPLLDEKIMALPFGPVPTDVYDALKIARGEEAAKRYHKHDSLHIVYDAIGYSNEYFLQKESANLDYISPAALISLDHALSLVSRMSFDDVLHTTHQEEWHRAYNSSSHVMNPVAIAKEGGIDSENIPYLKYSLELDAMLQND